MFVQQARNNPIFFAAFQNAMGQGMAQWGSSPQLGQQLNNFAQMVNQPSFSMGGAPGQGFGAMFGSQWGNMNRNGFLSPLGQNPMQNVGFMNQMPGTLNHMGQCLNKMNNILGPGGFAQNPSQVPFPTQFPGLPGRQGPAAQQLGQYFQNNQQMVQKLLGLVQQSLGRMQQLLQGLMGKQQQVQNNMQPRLPGAVKPPTGQAGANKAQVPGEGNGMGVGGAGVTGAMNAADQKVADHIKNCDGKKWLTSHGSYKKVGGNYEFTKGVMAGYKAIAQGNGTFEIQNKEGQEVGTYKAPKGQNKVASPVAFDLNGDGKLGTTGQTTAKNRNAGTEMGRTVQFDIDGDGKKDTIEWMDGKGDGLLVDNSDGRAATDMNGKRLFGDEGGKFANGYDKLAGRDANGDGKLTGQELQGLQMWVDNGDAKVDDGELKDLAGLGITEINVKKNDVQNARGETLMQSSATANGKQMLTEDVWFGKKS